MMNFRKELELAIEVVILNAVEFEGIVEIPEEKQKQIDKMTNKIMELIINRG